MNRLLRLFVLSISQLVLITQVGWAADGQMPLQGMQEDDTGYVLTLKTQPAGAGSFNRSSGEKHAAGEDVYVYYYNNEDFVFDHWESEGKNLSSERSLNFTMPSHDAELIAVFRYEPGNPGDPNAYEKKYTLTLTAEPKGACSFNRNSGEKYAAGEEVSAYYYINEDYVFDHWESEGKTLSTERNLKFIMPSHDAELKAVFNYSPGSPADPDTAIVKYTVTLEASPKGAGYFNWSEITEVYALRSYSVYAYNNTDFEFREWQQDGKTISTDRTYSFEMPYENLKFVAVYDYKPSNPGNPSSNYWNAETGEAIVDDFTPGELVSAIDRATGSSRDKVTMLTIGGRANNYDWGVLSYYTNCSYLDLSRTYGMTIVPSYNFSGNEVLTDIILPSSIETIEYYAFRNCTSLQSVSCYAAQPPKVDSQAFEGVNSGLVVYVPVDALSLYQEADVWKDFTILPLAAEVSGLEVNLPATVNPELYKDMFLELINTRSGQIQRYVITDRSFYTFNSLPHNTYYMVQLVNRRGDVLGKIDDISVKEEDVSVTFDSLKTPLDLTLTVRTPEGRDVTNRTTITWMDEKGTYLTKGKVLTGQLEGTKALFRIQLPEALAMEYLLPEDSLYEAQATNNIIYDLKAIPTMTISGSVRDVKTGLAINGAVVSVSQLLNDKYSKAFTVKTDTKGAWSLQVYKTKTDITASMTDYVNQTQSFEQLPAEIPAFELKDISGTTISLRLTYTDTNGETQNYYSDYANVSFEVINETTGKQITELSEQYPQIVLMEQLPENTVIRVKAVSKNGKFMPVNASGTVDESNRASVTLPIKQLGGIAASFKSTDNNSVVAILYDAKGQFIKKYEYSSATLNISELIDGEYTLVSMANSQFFNSIYSLQQFGESGLKEGVDYVKNTVTVKSGEIAQVNNDQIPHLDETKLFYTGENTSITVNKTQVTAGQYLTLSAHIDFKAAYAGSVSDVMLIVDLPDESSFVENSVMVGSKIGTYTYSAHTLTVPLSDYSDRVRFCIIPTLGGLYSPSASVQFTLNGKTVTQPIGNVNFEVKDLSITVPSKVAKPSITVNGIATPSSNVEIYDGENLIGQTISMANGLWIATCDLADAYNLSTHKIHAKVTSKAGLVFTSETQDCLYDMNAIEAKTVQMTYYNGWLRKNITVTFNFENGTVSDKSYMFYTGTDITFIADLTNNDPNVVHGVQLYVYTDQGEVRELTASYDEKKDRWVAVSRFESNNLPINLSIDIDAETSYVMDAGKGDADALDIENLVNTFNKAISSLDTFFSDPESITDESLLALANELQIDFVQPDEGDVDMSEFANMSDEEFEAYLDKKYAELVAEDDELVKKADEYKLWMDLKKELNESFGEGTTYSLGTCDGMTRESLLSDGYEETVMANGSTIYTLTTETVLSVVSLEKNVVVTVTIPAGSNVRMKMSAREFADKVKEVYDKIKMAIDTINNIFDEITKTAQKPLEEINKAIESLEKRIKQVQRYKNMCNQRFGNTKLWKWRLEEFRLQKALGTAKLAGKVCKPIVKGLLKCLPVLDYIATLYDCYTQAEKISSVFYSIPDPCKEDQAKANSLQAGCAGILVTVAAFAITDVLGNFTADAEIVGGALASVATAGTSLAAVGWGIVQKVAVQIGKEVVKHLVTSKGLEAIEKQVKELKCEKDPDDKDKKKKKKKNPPRPPFDPINPIHDPSGYVYEGVASNRLQGVTASCYYKETVEDMYGDLHENIVLWNAEEYAQKNPLFTDENGMYQWDVPQGLWQVKFEKEGYQTTYSEWLPVPPPQLEVNIPMVQMRQPTVSTAKAYDLGVEIAFDKYMDPETLTTDNISVTKNGNKIEGSIVLLDEEVSYEGEETTFASKLRFEVPKGQELTTTDQVMLTVSKAVKSYAGVQMENDYSQEFDVLPIVRKILADSLVNIAYGGERKLTVAASPIDAAKGKTLTVKSLSEMIAKTRDNTLTFDENGQAELTVTGELPGSTVLTFMVDGSDVEGTVILNVKDAANMITKAPAASRVSGTEVYSGTKILLASETDGATIYYTLDGSCPCDSETRLIYNPDEPIVITEDDVVIKAMAQGVDLPESDVTEFTYTLKKASLNYQMPKDWKWISHNLTDPVKPADFQNVERIVSQTEEVINDPKAGLIGNLQTLLPTEAYKVKTSTAYEKLLQGYEFNAGANAVPLETGWNWIGYPVSQTMAISEALAFFTPSEGDIIVGQDGSAEFVSGSWNGTLVKMTPSQGYLYKSGKKTEIEYNTSIVSNAASRLRNSQNLANSPWAYNKYAYANIMPVTAQLYDRDVKVADDEYIVGAFAGTECRGIGSWIDGRLMMNVYGDGGEDIRFIAFNTSDERFYNLKENVTFTADNVGSWRSPYYLSMGGQTTDIEQLNSEFSVTPTVFSDYITVRAGGRNINRVTLTNTGGLVVVTIDDLGSGGTITTSSVPEGIYIVTVQAEGLTYYKKIIKTNK